MNLIFQKRKRLLKSALGSIFFLCLLTLPSYSQERIINFHSEYEILPDGYVDITEHITVRAEGYNIRRGIYRDLPVRYRDDDGSVYNARPVILSVRKNGEKEPYHTEFSTNNLRIYIGKKDEFLKVPEVYKYTIAYRTKALIRTFEDYDEFYWDVTGDNWGFRIDSAVAEVHFPDSVKVLSTACYTGKFGSTVSECRIDSSSLLFFTTTLLSPGENFTIAVGFNKNFVKNYPGKDLGVSREVGESIRDFRFFAANYWFVPVGIVLSFVALFFMWWKWQSTGRDPLRRSAPPLFEPPENMKIYEIGMYHKLSYDKDLFTAALVELANRGYINITKSGRKYELHKLKSADNELEKPYRKILSSLFNNSKVLEVDDENYMTFASAQNSYKSHCSDILKGAIQHQWGWVALSWLMITASATMLLWPLMLWFSLWIAGALSVWHLLYAHLVKIHVRYYENNRYGWAASTRAAVWISLISILFIGAPIFIFYLLLYIPILFVFILIFLYAMWGLFVYLIKRPADETVRLQEKIEGFKMYLDKAEKLPLEKLVPPEKSLEHYEHILPYAIALGVENSWADYFEDELAAAARTPEYRSRWYSNLDSSPGRIANTLGSSFSRSLSRASVNPSSGSGSGGGGFSGGGGGGGGGGGW